MRVVKLGLVLGTLTLAACGGGAKSEQENANTVSTTLALSAACSGSNCAASGTGTYGGSGIGVWSVTNSTSGTANVPIALSGLATSSNVTLVWSNTGSSTVTMPSTAVSGASAKSAQGASAQGTTSYAVGTSTLSWYDTQNSNATIATTLRAQCALSTPIGSDATSYANIWVDDAVWKSSTTKYYVTTTQAEALCAQFATATNNLYDMVTGLTGGVPWGNAPTDYPEGMISTNQNIQIVLTDMHARGTLAYYDPVNTFYSASSNSYNSSSTVTNQKVAFFVDSYTYGTATTAAQFSVHSALARELVRAINFYERYMGMYDATTKTHYKAFAPWLENMAGLMVQDFVDSKLGTGTMHNLVDTYFSGWLSSAAYNCSLSTYTSSSSDACFSDYSAGSYGGFLLRQMGGQAAVFYKALLNYSTDISGATTASSYSLAVLNAAIMATDSSNSLATSLRRWGASIALLNSSILPANYGYPSVTASGVTLGSSTTSYTLPVVDGSLTAYAGVRSVPSTLPGTLKPYSQSAKVYAPKATSFSHSANVPAGATLTVIVN